MNSQHKIKSFMSRKGRIGETKKQIFSSKWSEFGLDFKKEIFNFAEIFKNLNPVVLEIGFGMGNSLVQMAKERSDFNFLGIDVYHAGVVNCVTLADENALTNLKIINFDATEILNYCIANNSLSGVQIFFPDPWPKKKHHKRRLIQPDFIKQLLPKIAQNGFIHLATDCQDYAFQMLEVLSQFNELTNQAETFLQETIRPKTKFENKALLKGGEIFDLYFIKSAE